MCEVMEKIQNEGREEGREEGVFALIATLLEMNVQPATIIKKVAEKFGLLSTNAEHYFEEYQKAQAK